MNEILTGVNYFAGWWEPLPNKWHRHADSFAIEQGDDWRPDFPERVPLLGEFNNQQTLDKELEVAANYGVDFFPILWYYNEKEAEREPHSSLLNNIFDDYLNSSRADRVKFFIEFCNHPPFDVTEDWQWQECLDAWEKIITHPSYIKVGGKAVFKIHGADYFIQQNKNNIPRCVKQLDSIRELFRSKGMEVIIGAGVMAEQHIDADNPIAEVFDFTCTYMDFPNLETKDTDYPYGLLGEYCRLARRVHSKDAIPYMPYMPAGWSPRPWPDTRACFAFPTREEWRKELELMRKDLETLPNLGLPDGQGGIQAAFNCYAWNEFGEGGIVAPTMITEYMKLEELNNTFKKKSSFKEKVLDIKPPILELSN